MRNTLTQNNFLKIMSNENPEWGFRLCYFSPIYPANQLIEN